MPEGDTVYRTARLLDRSLSGQRLDEDRLPGASARHRRPERRHRGRDRLARQAPAHPHRPRPGPVDPAHAPEDGGRLEGAHAAPAVAAAGAHRSGRPRDGPGHGGGVLARCRRAARPRGRGRRRRAPRPRPARPGLGRGARARQPHPRPRANAPRGAARPDQPGRHRQHVRRRALLHLGRAPADPGRGRARPAPAGSPGPPDARAQQGAAPPVHHRRPSRAGADVGLPPRPVAVPSLRHAGGGRAAGAGRTGAGVVLVPVLPAPCRPAAQRVASATSS